MDQALQLKVEQHSTDIKELTVNVSKLATIVEYSEKDKQQDRETMRDVARTLSSLSEKIHGLLGIEKELTQCIKEIATVRHDLASTASTVNGLAPLLERTTKIETEVDHLKSLKDKLEGGAVVIGWVTKIAWALGGAGFLALITFLVKLYFNVDLEVGGHAPIIIPQ